MRKMPVQIHCYVCGKTFSTRNTRIQHCSRKCIHVARKLNIKRPVLVPRPTTEERFWANVDKSDDCWHWTAAKVKRGYGRFVTQNCVYAHRYSYLLHFGTIPEGMCVCHRCDNPQCVNPAHLFLGTVADNNKDRSIKGRSNRRPRPQKLTPEIVGEIRTHIANGLPHSEIASLYDISISTVSHVRTGATWAHV